MTISSSRHLFGFGTAILGLTLLVTGCQSDSQQAPRQRPAPPVTVLQVEPTSAEVIRTYAGRIHGAREVEVRTRVQGILEERLFEEGERVEQGASLFRIDPEPFSVALQATKAEEQSVTAELNQAEREWQRISRLYEQNAVSQREYDNARSTYELAQARKALAQARTAQAELELDYTRVEAPLSGITSLEVLPEGSLVERGTLLTTIVQLDPIHIRFSLPEQDATIQRHLRATSSPDASAARRQVKLIMPNGSIYEREGIIDFTASTVDSRTGTVPTRAVFANPDDLLVPGQFVRVQVLLQNLTDIFVIPQTAIVQGPQGTSVFVIDSDDKAQFRPVTLGAVTEKGQIVLDGLSAQDEVVINGQVSLSPGAQVKVVAGRQENN